MQCMKVGLLAACLSLVAALDRQTFGGNALKSAQDCILSSLDDAASGKPLLAHACGAYEDCVKQYDFFHESNTTELSWGPEKPKHINLLPIDVRDVLAWTIVCVTLFVAAGGGIGGGGVLVPVFIIVLQFQTEHAVALSNLTIAGGAFANLICNVKRKHPAADRPLIDWDLILVMEPMTIFGALVGGMMNKVLPLWLTTVLLCALLASMSAKLWMKGTSMYHYETERNSEPRMEMPQLNIQSNGATEEPLLQNGNLNNNKAIVDQILSVTELTDFELSGDVATSPTAYAVRDLLAAERQQVPYGKVLILCALFVWLLISQLLKNRVSCGGVGYWLLVLSVVPAVALVVTFVRPHLIRKRRLKSEVGLALEEGDIEWTHETTLLYPAICSMAGVIAGMFGVGGGIVKGPLMLQLGVLPEVAAATSATMILFTSCSASVVYLTFGGIKWDYGIGLVTTGFTVTLLGQMLTYHIIATCGRRSVIILAMAILLSAGAVIMVYESGAAFVDAVHHGWFQISSLCS